MHRRVAVVLLVGLGLSIGGAAGAQTTTTSTSTSSSTTTSSVPPTSTSSTTSTTVPNPCLGQACTSEPPVAYLSGADGEAALDRGSYCWRSPAPDADGHFLGICVDMIERDPDAVLVVQAGEALSLRFGAMAPTEVHLLRAGQSTTLTPGNPVRLLADMPAGVHVLRFLTRWLQGDASYSVRLDVRRAASPATPQTGGLALTG